MRGGLAIILGLAVAGCGRLDFGALPHDADATSGDVAELIDPDGGVDARPCVNPSGHDEDGDGVDDACDVCPQRADSQLDSDGDGIGDACDPGPGAHVRLLFDPFTESTANWNYGSGTLTGDALRFTTLVGGAGAILQATPGRDTYEVTGTLLASSAAGGQLSISLGDGDDAHYYCEIYDNGSVVQLLFTYTPDEIDYMTIDSALLPGRFDSGRFRLRLEHAPPMTTCFAEWGGTSATTSGTNPPLTPTVIGVTVFQVELDMEAFERLGSTQ